MNKTKQAEFAVIDNGVDTVTTEKNNESNNLDFNSNGMLTLGVEIELQLIDKVTYNLCARSEEVLNATHYLSKVKSEFYLSTIEIITDKCNSVQAIEEDLCHTIAELLLATKQLNILFSTTGTHPFSKYSDWVITPEARYQDLIDRNQWLAQRMNVYGLHIHLGMLDGDECIRFKNMFRHFVPHLLALSASSPFWQGIDTGLASSRSTVFESLPTAGQPYCVEKWQDFELVYQCLKSSGSVKTIKDLWWDLRPSPNYGTLEIRICDGVASISETLAIVAFVHLMAYWFSENGGGQETRFISSPWLARENKWRAIRYGLDAEIVSSEEGKTNSIRDEINEWITLLEPYTLALGYQNYILHLQSILDLGTSACRQRKIYSETGCFKKVTKHNVSEFLLQAPLHRY